MTKQLALDLYAKKDLCDPWGWPYASPCPIRDDGCGAYELYLQNGVYGCNGEHGWCETAIIFANDGRDRYYKIRHPLMRKALRSHLARYGIEYKEEDE